MASPVVLAVDCWTAVLELAECDFARLATVHTWPGVASSAVGTHIGSSVLKAVREAGLELEGRDQASASVRELEGLEI